MLSKSESEDSSGLSYLGGLRLLATVLERLLDVGLPVTLDRLLGTLLAFELGELDLDFRIGLDFVVFLLLEPVVGTFSVFIVALLVGPAIPVVFCDSVIPDSD